MFGILKPMPSLLSKQERLRYATKYCNLCGLLRSHYDLKSRLLVVHDVATLWWLLENRSETNSTPFQIANCLPGRFSNDHRDDSQELGRLLAAISALMVGVKVSDDIADAKQARSKLMQHIYKDVFERARLELVELDFDLNLLDEILVLQKDVEDRVEADLELAIEPTAAAYALIAAEINKRCASNLTQREAEKIGRELGKSVYLADALVDFKADRDGNYNPLRIGVDRDCVTIPLDLEQSTLGCLGDCLKSVRSMVDKSLKVTWHAVERSVMATAGVNNPKHVMLYLGCCIPCGDGAVYVDKKDYDSCINTCACICCISAIGQRCC